MSIVKNIFNFLLECFPPPSPSFTTDCNTGFAKQNLVLNGDFVPVHFVNLHKILQMTPHSLRHLSVFLRLLHALLQKTFQNIPK